jgi:hypothetical protein
MSELNLEIAAIKAKAIEYNISEATVDTIIAKCNHNIDCIKKKIQPMIDTAIMNKLNKVDDRSNNYSSDLSL